MIVFGWLLNDEHKNLKKRTTPGPDLFTSTCNSQQTAHGIFFDEVLFVTDSEC